jgi:hypothetical protein
MRNAICDGGHKPKREYLRQEDTGHGFICMGLSSLSSQCLDSIGLHLPRYARLAMVPSEAGRLIYDTCFGDRNPAIIIAIPTKMRNRAKAIE